MSRGLLLLALMVAAQVQAQSPAINPPAQTRLTVLHTFTGMLDGAAPQSELVEGEDGVFYGTTSSGGTGQGGTVFKVTSAGTFTNLFSFDDPTTSLDGSYPAAGVVRGADGTFYGSTSQGGSIGGFPGGTGTVFRITNTGTLTTLHTFNVVDGAQPFANLLLAQDGNFYGTTIGGGAGGFGTVFRLSPAGQLTTVHDLAVDQTEGASLQQALVQDAAGDFYGTTHTLGFSSPGTIDQGGGTVFRMTAAGVLTTLKIFNYSADSPPEAITYRAADNAIYGTNGRGAFRITTAGTFTQIHNLQACSCGTPEGGFPVGQLVLASDGNFYGATSHGGTHNAGALYSMTPAGVITPLHSFNVTDGERPGGGLVEGRDGRFYGTTAGFSTGVVGNVFKLTLLPEAPSGPAATAGVQKVTLQWNAVRTANTYDVFVGTIPGVYATPTTAIGLSMTSREIIGLTAGTTYYFKVVAVNEAGSGPGSVEVSATPTAPPPAAAVPKSGGGGGVDGLLLAILALSMLGKSARARHKARKVSHD